MRWRKVKAITAFEFLSTVKRPGYLIGTFAVPLFVIAIGALGGFVGKLISEKEKEARIVGVVDRASVLQITGDARPPLPVLPPEMKSALEMSGQSAAVHDAIAMESVIFRPFADDAAARAALQGKEIRSFYVIADDFMVTGQVDGYSRADGNVLRGGGVRDQLEQMIKDRLLAGRIPEDIRARIEDPIAKGENHTIDDAGKVEKRSTSSVVAKIIIPIFLVMLLMFSMLGATGSLLQAVAVEKENRVAEVLIASASPNELMTGKLLGLGGAGLLQMMAWFGMFASGGVFIAGLLAVTGVSVPWGALALAFAYFLTGYFFCGSLMLGVGSLGSTQKEAQQWALLITMPIAVPMMFFSVLITDPHGTLAQIFTWIPFTAPLTVLLRTTLEPDGIAWWEIAGSLATMLLATAIAINVGARLFRIGMVLGGSPPKFTQILRQAGLMRG